MMFSSIGVIKKIIKQKSPSSEDTIAKAHKRPQDGSRPQGYHERARELGEHGKSYN